MIKKLFPITSSLKFSPETLQVKKDSVPLLEDVSQTLDRRSFEGRLSDTYSGKEFNYDLKDGDSQNFIARAMESFFKWIHNTFGLEISPGMVQLMEYVIYVLLGVLAIYLLVRFLVGENLPQLFTKKAGSLIDLTLGEEHIENLDLDGLLRTALAQNDYRLAIRYHYLGILKSLSGKGLIEWHFDKTNADYIREIPSPNIKTRFEEVSYLYDHVWYGEQALDAQRYKVAEDRFLVLKTLLPPS